jgi:hypothetical protein
VADNYHRYGFRFYKGQFGELPKGEIYHVADAYQAQVDGAGASVDLNIGDPVKMVADGSVALANTTDSVYGIIVAVHKIWESAMSATRPADRVPGGTTGGGVIDRTTQVEVVPARGIVWECDVNDNVTATTEVAYRALIHENVEHACAGDFSIAGRPKADPRLAISTHNGAAGGAALGWRIVGISKNQHNRDFSGANVKLLVKVNESSEAGAAAATVPGI